MAYPLLFALAVLIAGTAVGTYVDGISDAIKSAVGPHLVLLAALGAALGSIASLAGMFVSPGHRRSTLLFVLGFSSAAGLVAFYVGLVFCLKFLGEFPTRNLVAANISDLPSLLDAAPLTRSALVAACVAFAALLLTCGWAAGRGLLRICRASSRWPRTRLRALCVGVPGLSGAFYVAAVMAVAQPWQLDRREPVASSWHNISVRGATAKSGPDAQEWQRDRQACAIARTPERRPNVILIYVDALRADVTQPYGGIGSRANMPFMTRMVRSGAFVQADLAMAACTSTMCGLAALLQSRPARLQHPDFCSLPRVLKDVGYRTAFVLASNHQDFMELHQHYHPADFYIDGKDLGTRLALDDSVLPAGLNRLGPWQGSPVFLMVGLVSVHALGRRAEAFRTFRPDYRGSGEDASFAERYRNNYHNGILQADANLQIVWETLKAGGYLDDAIVVVTADHGESLGERKGVIGHMVSLDQSELHVPLWIHESRPSVGSLRFARQVDVAPTIVRALGMSSPDTWHGRPLQESLAGSLSEHVSHHLPHAVAVVHFDGETAIKLRYDRAATREQAFELFSDPREERDVLTKVARERLREMRGAARAAVPPAGAR